MSDFLTMYRAQLRTAAAIQLQYRVSALIWLLATVLQPVIYLIVWTSIAASHGGQVGGYTSAGFAAYFIVVMLVSHLTDTWVMWVFEYRVRLGEFSPLLLKPVHPIHADVAENVAHKLMTMTVMAPAAILLAFAFRPEFNFRLWAVVAFAPALAFGAVLCFVVGWTLGLTAFWTTRVNAIYQVYFVAFSFISGQIAPLSLFPAPVRVVASLLPFRWIVAFPAELLLGRLQPRDAGIGIAAQLIWLLLALGLLGLLWRAAQRRYAAVGA